MPGGERQKLTVTLEVDPTSSPIEGVARDECGVERPFTGWLGLATALEHALEMRVAGPRRHPGGRETMSPGRRQ